MKLDSLCDVYLALPIERYLTASLVLANMILLLCKIWLKYDRNSGHRIFCIVVCPKCWTVYLILLYIHQWFLMMFFLAQADIRVTFGLLLWSCLRNLTDMWSNQLPFSGYLQSVLIAVFLFLFKFCLHFFLWFEICRSTSNQRMWRLPLLHVGACVLVWTLWFVR
jgi:hypothetical protein